MVVATVDVQLDHRVPEIVEHGLILDLRKLHGAEAVFLLHGAGQGQANVLGFRCVRVPVLLGQFRKFAPHPLEALQQLGGEQAAFAIEDHIYRLVVGDGGFVDPGGGQGVVGVGQANRLGADGDLVALESLGVAVAIPPLVVIQANIIDVAQIHGVADVADLLGQLAAHGGVGLHDLELLRGQRAGLGEDLVRNGDLADVVKGRGGGDPVDLHIIQLIFRMIPGDLLQQQPGKAPDPQDMVAGFGAAVFNNGRQGIHHGLVGVSDGATLVFHQSFQVPLVGVQIHQYLDSAADGQSGVGLVDHVLHAHQKSGLLPLAGAGGADEADHRDLRFAGSPGRLCQRLEAGAFGGGKIRNDRSDALAVLPQKQDALLGVLGFQEIKAVFKDGVQGAAVAGSVAYQQKRIFHSGFHGGSSPLDR